MTQLYKSEVRSSPPQTPIFGLHRFHTPIYVMGYNPSLVPELFPSTLLRVTLRDTRKVLLPSLDGVEETVWSSFR